MSESPFARFLDGQGFVTLDGGLATALETAGLDRAGAAAALRRGVALPIIVYPNSGEGYDPLTRSWTGPPVAWIDAVGEWVEAGAVALGGCCRVGPAQIRNLRTKLEEMHAL